MQWTAKGEKAPKKAKVVHSAGKDVVSVFSDMRGNIHIDYLQKGRTIIGAYYVKQLEQLSQAIHQKRPSLLKTNFFSSKIMRQRIHQKLLKEKLRILASNRCATHLILEISSGKDSYLRERLFLRSDSL